MYRTALFGLSIFCASISLSPTHAMDHQDEKNAHPPISNSELQDSSFDRFASFKGLSREDYIKKCMPKLSPAEQEKAIQRFNKLISQGNQPILEDGIDKISASNLGKVLPESGYSYSPIMEIQGPFLSRCARGSLQHILNIGAGNGNDDIMALATGNVQIIAADIHKRQINQLQERIKEFYGQLLPQTFFACVRDFTNETPQTVPVKWIKGFDDININKVLHFLTDSQIKVLMKNCYTMAKDEDSRLYITVNTPRPDSAIDKYFKERKRAGVIAPGLIYYDRILGTNSETTIVPQDSCQLTGPGYKIEFLEPSTQKIILRQGRHYQDIETLTPYLKEYFDILDTNYYYNYEKGDFFLSVIAKKRKS